MWQNAHESYLESRILSADPIELTAMLYEAATGAVRDARRHLASGEIMERAKSISKASAILIELASSLDHSRGGAISTNLAQLYDYMLRRLTEANVQKSDEILGEVLGLLATLAEGWEGVRAQRSAAPTQPAAETAFDSRTSCGGWQSAEPPAEEAASVYGDSWAQLAAQETGGGYTSHNWSL